MSSDKTAEELALEYIDLEEQMIASVKRVKDFDKKICEIDEEINELFVEKK